MTRQAEGAPAADPIGAQGASPNADLMFREASSPRVEPRDAVTQAFLSGTGAVGEDLRLIQAKIRGLDEERRLQCFGMVSSAAGEGKSMLALGLAAQLAQEQSVLLVESDLRKPVLETSLGIPRHPGLAEWLEGDSAEVPLHRIVPGGFSLLSAGESKLKRPELLGGVRMRKLMDAARQRFDVVILDCAPLLPVADSVILQDVVDGFLLVVRARVCPRETILQAVSHLKAGRIRGVVFNDHRELIPGYDTYGARRYGYR